MAGHRGRDKPLLPQNGDGENGGGVEVGAGAHESAGEVVETEDAVGGGGYQQRTIERCTEILDRHEQDV